MPHFRGQVPIFQKLHLRAQTTNSLEIFFVAVSQVSSMWEKYRKGSERPGKAPETISHFSLQICRHAVRTYIQCETVSRVVKHAKNTVSQLFSRKKISFLQSFLNLFFTIFFAIFSCIGLIIFKIFRELDQNMQIRVGSGDKYRSVRGSGVSAC